VTLQRALVAASDGFNLANVNEVMAASGVSRFSFWSDGVGTGPKRVLTIRCLPAGPFERVLRHLGHLPSADLDVLCPVALADKTSALPGIRRVIPFEGPALDLDRLPAATLETIRGNRYDLCVVPRRGPSGRGFENVTRVGEASGAATTVWMDVTGACGPVAGLARGWEPWVTEPPPWEQVAGLRARAEAALRHGASTGRRVQAAAPAPLEATRLADEIVAQMDEFVVCQALVDNPASGIELSPLLLHQRPAVKAARDAVTRLRQAGRAAGDAAARTFETTMRRGVEWLSEVAAGPEANARAQAAQHLTDRLAAHIAAVELAPDRSRAEADALHACEALVRSLAAFGSQAERVYTLREGA
jgi:hypothetical protein